MEYDGQNHIIRIIGSWLGLTAKNNRTNKGVYKEMKEVLEPNYLAGGYTLHLYCKYENDKHDWNEFPHEYVEDSKNCKAICFRYARKDGWIIHRDSSATCPKCAK